MALVITDVTVHKDGQARSMLFNGTTSEINCGTVDTLVGDKSCVFWFKGYEYSGVVTYFMSNTIFAVAFDTPNNELHITSDGGGTIVNDTYTLPVNEYTCIIVVRNTAGLIDFYENGVLVYTGLDTGTPAVGTDIKINVEPTTFKGLMPSIRIIDGLLNSYEINQIYTSEKWMYGL